MNTEGRDHSLRSFCFQHEAIGFQFYIDIYFPQGSFHRSLERFSYCLGFTKRKFLGELIGAPQDQKLDSHKHTSEFWLQFSLIIKLKIIRK